MNTATTISEQAQRQLNLGIDHHKSGNLESAVQCYLRVLEENRAHPDANHLLGLVANETGDSEGAILLILKAIESLPNQILFHTNLGNIFHKLGRLDEAVFCIKKALEIKPDEENVRNNLGVMLIEQGLGNQAFAIFRDGIAISPKSDLLWVGLAESLAVTIIDTLDDTLFDDLLALLEYPSVAPPKIVQPILGALLLDPGFQNLLLKASESEADTSLDYVEAAKKLCHLPLLLRLMELSYFKNLDMENLFTKLRRGLLGLAMADEDLNETEPFSVALALHCFVNEYVFFETTEEEMAVDQLQNIIVEGLNSGSEISSSQLLALACYRPLHQIDGGENLLEKNWPDAVSEILRRQISEPLEEIAFRPNISELTEIQDGVSASVRSQYEENPYPRWIKAWQEPVAKPVAQVLVSLELNVDLSKQNFSDKPDILIAGCGTGAQAIHASSRYLNGQITAVDLSLTSLSYAMRKTREMDIGNIQYRHGDILELAGIDQRFDVIECSGVLHHMADPMAGWRVLIGLLKPGGVMKIGLYSELARQAVVRARNFIAEQNYGTTAADIRRCRRDIIIRDDDQNDSIKEITNLVDFFSLSTCRDLIFHVQEHRFTVPQLEQALAELDLRFLGFNHLSQYVPALFRESHPDPADLYDLGKWHDFEQQTPNAFLGMYQFWCAKI